MKIPLSNLRWMRIRAPIHLAIAGGVAALCIAAFLAFQIHNSEKARVKPSRGAANTVAAHGTTSSSSDLGSPGQQAVQRFFHGPCPPGRAQFCERLAQSANPSVPPAPKIPPTFSSSSSTTPTQYITGIETSSQSPVPGLPFLQTTIWGGSSGSQHVLVSAGSVTSGDPSDPYRPTGEGELIQVPVVLRGNPVVSATIVNVEIPGPWTLKSVSGERLTVAGSNGQTFVYDASLQKVTTP